MLRDYIERLKTQVRMYRVTRLADQCGVSRPTIYNWLNGHSELNSGTLIAIDEIVNKKITLNSDE